MIPKACRFGPLEGRVTLAPTGTSSGDVQQKFQLLIHNLDGSISCVDVSDEENSNWMRFVRPATNFSEQNAVLNQVPYIRLNVSVEWHKFP